MKKLTLAIGLGLLVLPPAQAAQGLAAALQASLQHNPAVRGKSAEVSAQNYAVESAKAQRLPSFSADLNNVQGDFEREQASVRIQQPLWTFGKIDTAIHKAEAGVQTEELSLLQIKRQLIEKVAVAYARIQGIGRQERVASENIVEHQRLFRHISRRQKGQLASDADVNLGTSRLILARSQLQRLQGERRNALTELTALTIVPVKVKGAIPSRLMRLPSVAEVQRLALQQNADLQVKTAKSSEARLAVTEARVAPLPNLYLRAEHDFSDDPVNTVDNDTRVGLVLEANFEGLGLVARGRTRGAEARYQASQEDISVTRTELMRQIGTLMSDQQVLADLIKAQKGAVSAVRKTAASYLRLYDSGHRSWSDVLNIQREVTEQRLQLEQLRSDRTQAALRVGALIGHLDSLAGLSAP